MKQIFTFAIALITFTGIAQQTFFEALQANSGKEYTQYLKVTVDDAGNFKPGEPYTKLVLTAKTLGDVPIGFGSKWSNNGKGAKSTNVTSRYERWDSYPKTSLVKHTFTGRGYLMIDDILFYVNGLKSGKPITAKNIESYYFPVGKGNATVAPLKKESNKKKGGFLKKFKKALADAGSNPGMKYFETHDIHRMLADYQSQMKSLQKSYTLTAKDRADIKKVEDFRKNGEAYIKRYNDSLYNSPEQKRIRADWKAINDAGNVTVRNNKNVKIYVSSRTNNRLNYGIEPGMSRDIMSCQEDMYYFYSDKEGAQGTKFYSAKSACGSSVTVN